MPVRLIVKNIPYGVYGARLEDRERGDQALEAFFAPIGIVTDLRPITDRFTQDFKGFAFVAVDLGRFDEERRWLPYRDDYWMTLQGKELGGRRLTIELARPKRPGGGSE